MRKSGILPGLAAGAVMALAATSAANACSLAGPYRPPTHTELVKMADAIVVAQAVEAAGSFGVRFRVISRIKGDAPDTVVIGPAFLGNPPPSDPNDIVSANPQAQAGGCIRYIYKAGASYVIFLRRHGDGELDILNKPFARVNEDYFGEDSLWMRTIRTDLAGKH